MQICSWQSFKRVYLRTWTAQTPSIWWRYIDDVFAIRERGQESLDSFLDQINVFHNTIKFTAEYSTERISFLDTTVILDRTTIHTDLYTKPTDTHQYLSPQSCHPSTAPLLFPIYSQNLRLRRICSRTEDFEERTVELKEHLLARGYKESLVAGQIRRAASVPRVEALQPRPRKQPLNRTPLVLTFHLLLTKLAGITRGHLPILETSQRLRGAILNPPLVAFR